MKVIALFPFFFLVLISCENRLSVISPTDEELMKGLSSYYGGDVSIKKGVFQPISGGEAEYYYRISLQCNDLKKYYPNEQVPASYCAWYCYSKLPESDRKAFNTYTVQVPFDNQQKSIEYTSVDLEMVLQSKPQFDSVVAYFVRADYQSLVGQLIPEVKKDTRLQKFHQTMANIDSIYGNTSDMKIRGFRILQFSQDSTSENREYLVQFDVLQIREKKSLKSTVTVSPHTLYGFVGGIEFE